MCLAIPGRLESLDETADSLERKGWVDFGGVRKEIYLAYLPEAKVGDYVLVHVGFAMSILDEKVAQGILEELESYEFPE